MMTNRGIAKGKQRGAALIEFTFVLIPLLMLTLGTLLYGLVVVSQQALTFAAQRGADAVVQVDPAPFRASDGTFDLSKLPQYCTAGQSLARERIQRVLPLIGLFNVFDGTGNAGPDGVAVTADTSSGQPGCLVTVTKSFFLHIPLVPLPKTLQGVAFLPVSSNSQTNNAQANSGS